MPEKRYQEFHAPSAAEPGGSQAETSTGAAGQSPSLGDSYLSAYADRIRQTPSLESNRWSGERGESVCAPQSDAARQLMQERGLSGVQYQNGVPDFSPVSESTVRLGYMTDARRSQGLSDGRDGKNAVYAHFEDGELISESQRADKNTLADFHMKYDKPGNFEQADALTAEQWTADARDGREWTAGDVAQYRQEHDLTWHECNDMQTMQMIPSEINADFGHLGGVGEIKEKQRMIDEALSQYDEGQIVEADDYNKMSSEELATMHAPELYDQEGVRIPDRSEERGKKEDAAEETNAAFDETQLDARLDNAMESPNLDGLAESDGEQARKNQTDQVVDAVEVEEKLNQEIPEPESAVPVDSELAAETEELFDRQIDEPEAKEESGQEGIDSEVNEPRSLDVEEAESQAYAERKEAEQETYEVFFDEQSPESLTDADDAYSDLADKSIGTPCDAFDYSDLADEAGKEQIDASTDCSDLADKVDMASYNDSPMDDDSFIDSSDVSLDADDTSFFDDGRASIE